MNKSDDKLKERNVGRAGGFPKQEKDWQGPSLTVWEVARNTGNGIVTKTGSGADSHGMREVSEI